MARSNSLLQDTPRRPTSPVPALIAAGAVLLLGSAWFFYHLIVIDIPPGHVGILIRKTGIDLEKNSDVIAPDRDYKGIQKELLSSGRHFLNPYDWTYEVEPFKLIPERKVGIRVRMVGEDTPAGELLSRKDTQKGVVPGYLMPGQHTYHKYMETILEHDMIEIPAGFKGVVVNLTGTLPTRSEHFWTGKEDAHPKKLLVQPGFRGVQYQTKNPGLEPINPFEQEIKLVDCRNQRFNLAESKDFGFPSKDGFWVRMDAVIEYRVNTDLAALVYVLYNEEFNGDSLDEEIVRKVIVPAARSFCRLQGSNTLGREFIQGGRSEFQEQFLRTMKEQCEPLGIDILGALVTKIDPPDQIATPVRNREIAKQKEKQYQQQILQQRSEQKLAVEKELVKQKQALVQAEQEVVRLTTIAQREQEVETTKGQEKLAVAQLKLEAAQDEAAAIMSRAKASAEVVELKNKAEAAGWKRAVEAFNGNGQQYAQYVLFQKISGAYRSIMVNTADSPIMKIFESFQNGSTNSPGKTPPVAKP